LKLSMWPEAVKSCSGDCVSRHSRPGA
jgi:hypothetical protein